MLREGGNIVDAAIAGAAVLAVALPYACGIGGDVYLLYYEARTGRVYGLNGTGAAPSGATVEMFPDGIPQVGVRSATVPGAVAGWDDALRRFGTRSLADCLKTAIRYAADGIAAHQGVIENAIEKEKLLLRNAEAQRLYLPRGAPLKPGDVLIQTDLAHSLSLIAERGAREFYEGDLARRIVDKIRALGGLFSFEDLATHRSLWQEPIHVSFYGHDIYTMPPNSQGLGLLLQLQALQAARIDAVKRGDPEQWRSTIAAWRWAAHVSKDTIGDPRDAESRARLLLGRIRSNSIAFSQASVPLPGSGDTSNLVIIDDRGNAVSLVQSVSAPFGSGVVLEGTGILLNNRMRGFNTDESSINCVKPGRRPAHTLVPVLVARGGRVWMAIGTPGAAGQTVTLSQVLSHHIACGLSVKEAIEVPRWSVAPSGAIMIERTASTDIIDALREFSPRLEIADVRHVRFGSVKAAWFTDGVMHAAADYRRVASAAAW